MKLIIDDERTLDVEDAVYARTFDEAYEMLHFPEQPFEEIWWDHDLGGERDAYDLASWLEGIAFHNTGLFREFFKGCKMFIHSQNPVGKGRLMMALEVQFDTTVVNELPLKEEV